MSLKKYPAEHVTINGEEIEYHRIDADVNGNPRYVVHFLALGIEPKDYGKIPNLTKYRAKWFGGGIVFQSASIAHTLQWYLNQVKEFYSN